MKQNKLPENNNKTERAISFDNPTATDQVPRVRLIGTLTQLPELCLTVKQLTQRAALQGLILEDSEADHLFQRTGGLPQVVDLTLQHLHLNPMQQDLLLAQWLDGWFLPQLNAMDKARLASLSLLSEFCEPQAADLLGMEGEEISCWVVGYTDTFFRRMDDGKLIWFDRLKDYFYGKLIRQYTLLIPSILQRMTPWIAQGWPDHRSLDLVVFCSDQVWSQLIIGELCRIWMSGQNAGKVLYLVDRLPLKIYLHNPNIVLCYIWAMIVQRRISMAVELLQKLDPAALDRQMDSTLPWKNIDSSLEVLNCLCRYYGDAQITPRERFRLLENCVNRNSQFRRFTIGIYTRVLQESSEQDLSLEPLLKAIAYHQTEDDRLAICLLHTRYWKARFRQGESESVINCAKLFLNGVQGNIQNENDKDALKSVALVKSSLAQFLFETGHSAISEPLYKESLQDLLQSEFLLDYAETCLSLSHCLTSQNRFDESLLLLTQLRLRLAQQPMISGLIPELCFELMRAYRQKGFDLRPLQEQYGDCFAAISLESLFQGQQDREAVSGLKCQLLTLLDNGDSMAALNYSMQGLIKSMHVADLRHRILFSAVKALCEYKLGRYSEARESMNGAMLLAQRFQFQYVIADDDFGWTGLWLLIDEANDFDSELQVEFVSGLRLLIKSKHHPATPSVISSISIADNSKRKTILPPHSGSFGLTEKELKILSLLTEGLCNKRIARRSEIALTTVKWHLQNIFGKLDVRNRTEAVVKAQELALVDAKA